MAIKKSELYSSLWQSCDELRGGMDASQYKDYVLTLLFVKYVSDKYAGDPYPVIVVPEGGSFEDIVRLKGDKEIGDKMNKIIRRLANENDLRGVIDLADFNDENRLGRGKEMVDRLSNLVGIFERLDLSANRSGGDDLLGDAYEYLMRNFATQSGKAKGQFYTPAEVSRVTAAWTVATETNSALKQGNYVQGTVLLVLRKRTGEHTAFEDEITYLLEEEVQGQLDTMRALDEHEDKPSFGDTDYQLAACAAALRVLTQYSGVEGRDIEHELARPRNDGEPSPIERVIEQAVKIAADHLVPEGLDAFVWKTLTPPERLYLKGLELEAHGEFRTGPTRSWPAVLAQPTTLASSQQPRQPEPLQERHGIWHEDVGRQWLRKQQRAPGADGHPRGCPQRRCPARPQLAARRATRLLAVAAAEAPHRHPALSGGDAPRQRALGRGRARGDVGGRGGGA